MGWLWPRCCACQYVYPSARVLVRGKHRLRLTKLKHRKKLLEMPIKEDFKYRFRCKTKDNGNIFKLGIQLQRVTGYKKVEGGIIIPVLGEKELVSFIDQDNV